MIYGNYWDRRLKEELKNMKAWEKDLLKNQEGFYFGYTISYNIDLMVFLASNENEVITFDFLDEVIDFLKEIENIEK